MYLPSLRFQPRRWSLDTTETGSEPVTLADVKDQLNYTDSDKDALISLAAVAARRQVETATGRAIRLQTRTLAMSDLPCWREQHIDLPGGRIQSVTAFTYRDPNGVVQTFTDYVTDFGTDGGTGRLFLTDDVDWPDTADANLPVTIVYVAGYDIDGSPPGAIPEDLDAAIRMVAADLFNHREAHSTGRPQMSPTLAAIFAAYRVWDLGQ